MTDFCLTPATDVRSALDHGDRNMTLAFQLDVGTHQLEV